MNENIENEKLPKILFVDDEENILKSIKRLLMDEPFEIYLANSGEKGLEILRDNMDVCLIVSDQRMPSMSGVEFLEKAKDILPDCLRMVLTGYADINAAMGAINKGGAFRYISKPWKDEELIQILRDAVQRFNLLKDNKELSEIIRKQNDELKAWNQHLDQSVQEQTIEIQRNNEELEKMNLSLKKNFKSTIIAFSGLLELRDKTVKSHSRNVAELSVKVAREAGLSDEEIEEIMVASLLHDIGKIGMPDIYLLKDVSEMNSEEIDHYRSHPIRGQAVVDSIEDLRRSGNLIRHHHEWFNGGGFPDKISGNEIPLGARIIAISDFIDRTISRTQSEIALEIALDNVKKELGKRFDPQLFQFVMIQSRTVYKKISSKTDLIEKEFHTKDLHEGMTISRDVRSGTGFLLLTKGTVLNSKLIESIKRSYSIDPSSAGIFIWVKR